jgi:hypothetical protein
MMLARKLPYFNTKTLTLNLANLELGEGFREFSFSFFSKVSFIYFFEIFNTMMGNQNMLWKRST